MAGQLRLGGLVQDLQLGLAARHLFQAGAQDGIAGQLRCGGHQLVRLLGQQQRRGPVRQLNACGQLVPAGAIDLWQQQQRRQQRQSRQQREDK